MASEKEIVKAVELVVGLLKNKMAITKDIDTLTLKRGDIQIELKKEKKKADQELADHRESVGMEGNALTTQLNSMKGELNRLPSEITSKKDSISALDEVIDGLKIQQAELEDSNKKLTEINDGMRADAKLRSKQLSEI